MKRVGDHLALYALGDCDASDANTFGRSAFNRYYYSAFLSVRSTLRTIDQRWASPPHKDVPILLRGEVLDRLKRKVRSWEKEELLGRSEGQRIYSSAATAAGNLSELLNQAREVRRLADYEPEVSVLKHEGVITLGDYSLDTAKGWLGRVEMQSKLILKAYKNVGLI